MYCIPATSALIECIFSHEGIFMRPYMACISDKVLHDFRFSKCSWYVFLNIATLQVTLQWKSENFLFMAVINVLMFSNNSTCVLYLLFLKTFSTTWLICFGTLLHDYIVQSRLWCPISVLAYAGLGLSLSIGLYGFGLGLGLGSIELWSLDLVLVLTGPVLVLFLVLPLLVLTATLV